MGRGESLTGDSFVGREAALDALHARLERALGGTTGVVFVTGEAGSGKTSLVNRFAARVGVERPDVAFAIGDCNAVTGATDAYLPFREVLGQLTGSLDARLAAARLSPRQVDRLHQVADIGRDLLLDYGTDLIGSLVPAGGLLIKVGMKVTGAQPALDRLHERLAAKTALARPAALDQSAIFEQYTNVIRALAARAPLVIVLDDLHWIDAASAGLLFHLARRLRDAPLLMVGTYRPADIAPQGAERHPLEKVLGEIDRYDLAATIALDADDPDAARAFTDALVDGRPRERVGTSRT